MNAIETRSTEESLYNQHLSDDDIREVILKNDEDGVYCSLTDEHDVVLDDDAIERVREQLATVEPEIQMAWSEFAEFHGTGADGSTDDYLLVQARDRPEALESRDYDSGIDKSVLAGAVSEVTSDLQSRGDNWSDFTVPLPDDVTLDDAEDVFDGY